MPDGTARGKEGRSAPVGGRESDYAVPAVFVVIPKEMARPAKSCTLVPMYGRFRIAAVQTLGNAWPRRRGRLDRPPDEEKDQP
jgi:hypothetical protein